MHWWDRGKAAKQRWLVPSGGKYFDLEQESDRLRLDLEWDNLVGSKALIKRPKVYWRDTSLFHSFFNVASQNELLDQPWVGASWEGFVIEQILGALTVTGCFFDACFLRTSDQHEIDLLIQIGSMMWAIVIKLTTQPSPTDMRKLNKIADLIGADKRFLVSQHKEFIDAGAQISTNLPDLIRYIEQMV